MPTAVSGQDQLVAVISTEKPYNYDSCDDDDPAAAIVVGVIVVA